MAELWLAPLPPITPRTGIAEIRDGPPGLYGTSARAGFLEGCSGLPGEALRPCDWTFAGADPADKGSVRGLLQAYGSPTRVSEKNPPGPGLAGFDVEPPANRSALFRGRPNRAEGGSSSTAL